MKLPLNGELNRFSSYKNIKLQTKNLTTLYNRYLPSLSTESLVKM